MTRTNLTGRARALCLLTLSGLAMPALAQEMAAPRDVVIVMDSSGSMWGQIGGVAKRDIARKALRDMLGGLPADTRLGLVAYGHRREGDCGDIEVVLDPGAGAQAVADKVDTLKPVGKTPLTSAVRKAAEVLKYKDHPATVILITDGIETCSADPCGLGAELEATGVDFTAHVVGFGLSDAEGRQVACLAEETGGRYVEASDASGLADALGEVAEAVTAVPEAEEEVVPQSAQASLSVPDSVEIGSLFEVGWEGPGGATDYLDLVVPGHARTSGELSYGYTSRGNPVTLRAPGDPGEYVVRYVWIAPQGREVIAQETITVVAAEVALIAPESVGQGAGVPVSWVGPGHQGDYIDLVPAGFAGTSGEIAYAYTERGNPVSVTAPGEPGEYELRYIAVAAGGERVLKTVPLRVEPVRTEIAFAPSAKLGETLSVDWTGPGGDADYVDIVPKGHSETSGELAYAYVNRGNPLALTLPGEAGEYEVRYVLDAPDGRRVLARAPLNLTETSVSLEFTPETDLSGRLEVRWSGPGARGDYVDIVPRGQTETGGEISYAYVNRGNPLEIDLPAEPGDYDVRYILDSASGRKVLATAPLTVRETPATLSAPAQAASGATVEVGWQGPGRKADYIDVVPRGSDETQGELSYAYVNRGNPLKLELPGTPGEYDIRYVLQGPGERRVLARLPLTVEAVDATLSAPASAKPETEIEIGWTGPGYRDDYIEIVPAGKSGFDGAKYFAYTNRGNPVRIKTPKETGRYTIRYVIQAPDGKTVPVARALSVE